MQGRPARAGASKRRGAAAHPRRNRAGQHPDFWVSRTAGSWISVVVSPSVQQPQEWTPRSQPGQRQLPKSLAGALWMAPRPVCEAAPGSRAEKMNTESMWDSRKSGPSCEKRSKLCDCSTHRHHKPEDPLSSKSPDNPAPSRGRGPEAWCSGRSLLTVALVTCGHQVLLAQNSRLRLSPSDQSGGVLGA